MQPHEAVEKKKRKEILIDNFLGGIAWGLGASIGVSIILAILGFIASKINLVPVIGTFVANILDVVLKTSHNNK
ncbi:MAG TPA: DUF5665 domain-containing protein [Candidatus Saccharimonadales bacterium]|nr:DUF5665 domain-containing protein [Candidatus Saccharimonadales bacterium]